MSKNQDTCDITIGGNTRVGVFPRMPVRFYLQVALRQALGLTDDSAPDPFAVPMVYFSIIGVCWPTPIEPTFRQCRHDTTEFGEIVFEHLAALYPDADLVSEASDVAIGLLSAMLGQTQAISEAAESEAVFIEGPARSYTTE